MNSTNRTMFLAASMVLLLAGIAIIILAFLNSPLELQIVFGFIGLGFIVLSLVPVGLARREQNKDDKFRQLMTKLDEIKEELHQQEEKQEKSGVAIADIINSGMKFYADYLNKDTDKSQEDENGPSFAPSTGTLLLPHREYHP